MDLRFFFNVSVKVSNQNYDDEKKTRVTLPLVSYSQTEDMPLSTNYKGYTYNDHVRDSVLCEPVVFVCYKQANS